MVAFIAIAIQLKGWRTCRAAKCLSLVSLFCSDKYFINIGFFNWALNDSSVLPTIVTGWIAWYVVGLTHPDLENW